MKKTLALILAMLVAFSMFSVATFAADTDEVSKLYTVKFVDYDYDLEKEEGTEFKTCQVYEGEYLTTYVPKNPVREDTDTTKYTFYGWKSSTDGITYYPNAIPAATENVVYIAVYKEEEVVKGQNLLQFFRSIFERINLIFQYFATIFNFDLDE